MSVLLGEVKHEVLMTNKFTRSSVDVSHGSPLTFILSKGYCSKHLTILPLEFDCFMPLPFAVSYRFFRHPILFTFLWSMFRNSMKNNNKILFHRLCTICYLWDTMQGSELKLTQMNSHPLTLLTLFSRQQTGMKERWDKICCKCRYLCNKK